MVKLCISAYGLEISIFTRSPNNKGHKIIISICFFFSIMVGNIVLLQNSPLQMQKKQLCEKKYFN